MITLRIDETAVSQGMVPVRWCLDPEIAKECAPKLNNLFVLLCIIPQNEKNGGEQRKLIPLTDLMTYVEFTRPGMNEIHAFLIEASREQAVRGYLSRSHGYWRTTVFDHDGSTDREVSEPAPLMLAQVKPDKTTEVIHARLNVDIPAGCFAKPPPAWEEAFVNFYWSHAPLDQCSYRKRRLIAYLTLPFVMTSLVITRIFIALCLAGFGFRGLDFKPIIHPLTMSTEDIWDQMGGSIFFRPPLVLISVSPVPVMILGLFLHVATHTSWFVSFWHSFVCLTLSTLAVYAVFGALFLITLCFHVPGFIRHWWINRDRTSADQERLNQALTALTCQDCMVARPGVSSLPSEFRTVRLRFYDLKAKVCRPFAR